MARSVTETKMSSSQLSDGGSSRKQGPRSVGVLWPMMEEYRAAEKAKPTRVILVDDHCVLRQGLRLILEVEPNIDVVGEAGDGVEGVQLAREVKPDVVVMDLHMPEMDGIAATMAIHRSVPSTEVILLSSDVDAASIAAGMRAGAIGFLGKSSSPDELCQAIRAVHSGQVYLAAEAATKLMQEMRAFEYQDSLSEREHDVLRLLVRGHTNAQIARDLGIREPTVSTHVANIMAKLRVHSRIEVALLATRKGLVPLETQEKVG
jgi:two-component system, NarL family, response regulator LiaR